MTEWIIKEHPDLLKDLDNLGNNILEIFYKKKKKIKEDPLRLKHLSGGENCYREAITNNIRLVYFIEGNIIWLLTIGRHDQSYKDYSKRIHTLRKSTMRSAPNEQSSV